MIRQDLIELAQEAEQNAPPLYGCLVCQDTRSGKPARAMAMVVPGHGRFLAAYYICPHCDEHLSALPGFVMGAIMPEMHARLCKLVAEDSAAGFPGGTAFWRGRPPKYGLAVG